VREDALADETDDAGERDPERDRDCAGSGSAGGVKNAKAAKTAKKTVLCVFAVFAFLGSPSVNVFVWRFGAERSARRFIR
jgi:hypothetical protein